MGTDHLCWRAMVKTNSKWYIPPIKDVIEYYENLKPDFGKNWRCD